MQVVQLISKEYTQQVGDTAPEIKPNIIKDTIFEENGVPVGFYIHKVTGKLKAFVDIANNELISNRVPKSTMGRSAGSRDKDAKTVKQYSTILGSCPPRPHMRRPYPSISSVHQVKTAKTFIKAMYQVALESEKVIEEVIPDVYKFQKEYFEKYVPKQWRFGNIFTSSINNCNISAGYHFDKANIRGCVNVIIVKKKLAEGGNTTVPEYGATVDSCDDSMLVYPAWKNLHAVTPIHLQDPTGYRNSLVLYPLKAFSNE